MRKYLVIVFAGISAGLSAQVISTEAPSMSASAVVVNKGVFQMESRVQQTQYQYSSEYNLPINLFRVGLSKRFELRFTNGYQLKTFSSKKALGRFNNVELGLKYAILANPEKKMKMALFGHVVIPSAKSNYYTAYATLCFSHAMKKDQTLSYNLNYTYSISVHHPYPSSFQSALLKATLCYSKKMTSKLSVFGEAYANAYTNSFYQKNDFSSSLNFDAGFYYLLRSNIQLDYTFGFGVTDRMAFQSIGLDIMFTKRNREIWK